MKLLDPEAHPWIGEIHKLEESNIFLPLYSEESSDCNHSADSNFQLSFLYGFSRIWTSLESVNLQPRITKQCLTLWSFPGKLYVENTVAISEKLQYKWLINGDKGCPEGPIQDAWDGSRLHTRDVTGQAVQCHHLGISCPIEIPAKLRSQSFARAGAALMKHYKMLMHEW